MAVTWKRLAYSDSVSSWGEAESVTIASGIVTANEECHNYVVIPEAAAAGDLLDKITNVPEHHRILVKANTAVGIVTLVSGAYLKLRGDFSLNGEYDNIVLIGAGSDVCYEESRCSVNLGDDVEAYFEDDDMRFGAVYDLTIAAGVITGAIAGRRNIRVETEGGAASDNLTSILGYAEGEAVVLSAKNAAHVVTIPNSGNFHLQGVAFTLNGLEDSIFLLNTGANQWRELSRSGN